MKKTVILFFIAFISNYSQQIVWPDIEIFIITEGGRRPIFSWMETNNAVWDQDYNPYIVGNQYLTSKYKNPLATKFNNEMITAIPVPDFTRSYGYHHCSIPGAGVMNIYGYGLYKINFGYQLYQPIVSFYLDYRDCDSYPKYDIWIKIITPYNVGNNPITMTAKISWLDGEFTNNVTDVINDSIYPLWEYKTKTVNNHLQNSAKFELYLTVSELNNHPYLEWNDYFNTDFIPNQFKIYRSIRSTFPTSESHFTCIATVSRSTLSYTDMSYEIGDDSKAWYRIKAYKSTSPTKYSLPSNTEGIDIDFPSKRINTNYFTNSKFNFNLDQNHPNPFNPSTVIRYELAEKSYVTLKIYDILGNEIANLVDEFKPEGTYEVEFIAADNLPSGIYFYKITADNFSECKKMILMK